LLFVGAASQPAACTVGAPEPAPTSFMAWLVVFEVLKFKLFGSRGQSKRSLAAVHLSLRAASAKF